MPCLFAGERHLCLLSRFPALPLLPRLFLCLPPAPAHLYHSLPCTHLLIGAGELGHGRKEKEEGGTPVPACHASPRAFACIHAVAPHCLLSHTLGGRKVAEEGRKEGRKEDSALFLPHLFLLSSFSVLGRRTTLGEDFELFAAPLACPAHHDAALPQTHTTSCRTPSLLHAMPPLEGLSHAHALSLPARTRASTLLRLPLPHHGRKHHCTLGEDCSYIWGEQALLYVVFLIFAVYLALLHAALLAVAALPSIYHHTHITSSSFYVRARRSAVSVREEEDGGGWTSCCARAPLACHNAAHLLRCWLHAASARACMLRCRLSGAARALHAPSSRAHTAPLLRFCVCSWTAGGRGRERKKNSPRRRHL